MPTEMDSPQNEILERDVVSWFHKSWESILKVCTFLTHFNDSYLGQTAKIATEELRVMYILGFFLNNFAQKWEKSDCLKEKIQIIQIDIHDM